MDMVHYAVDEQPDGRVIMKWSPDFYNPEDGVLNTQNIFEECKKILVPTLLIYGTRGVAQEETSRALLAAWPQAELAIVRDSGHSVYMEDPDVCAGEIATFFKKPAAQKGAVREYQVRANARAG
jgi:pimeloyl-ACP methyl ester carboxylesterase